MADCCNGNRTASAVTVRCRVVFSTFATCTGTTGSFWAVSLEQLQRNDRNKTIAQNIPRCQKTEAPLLLLSTSGAARQLELCWRRMASVDGVQPSVIFSVIRFS